MIIRNFHTSDLKAIEILHAQFFKDEFALPDFSEFIRAFVTEDEKGEIVSFAGIRTIIEMVAVSNRDKSPLVRSRALKELLLASKYATAMLDYDKLHAFTQGQRWSEALVHNGFKPCKGDALYLGI